MVFVCDKCHFLFSRTNQPEQCPDCGKYTVREAAEAEYLWADSPGNTIFRHFASKKQNQPAVERRRLRIERRPL